MEALKSMYLLHSTFKELWNLKNFKTDDFIHDLTSNIRWNRHRDILGTYHMRLTSRLRLLSSVTGCRSESRFQPAWHAMPRESLEYDSDSETNLNLSWFVLYVMHWYIQSLQDFVPCQFSINRMAAFHFRMASSKVPSKLTAKQYRPPFPVLGSQ
jgi:hypothetical protein